MKITRDELTDKLAHAMTDAVDMDTLLAAFWENQKDHFESLWYAEADTVIRQDAEALGLVSEDEDLIVVDGEEQYIL